MRVKFTSPFTNQVIFGRIIDFLRNSDCFAILGDDGNVYRLIQPNSDYNFRFIQNEEAERKYAAALNRKVDELEQLDKQARRSK